MNLTHIKDHKNSWTVVIENESYTFDSSHPEYLNLVDAVKTADADRFISVHSVGSKIENWSEGSFRFEDGNLYYKDECVHHVVTNRIVNMMKEGFDYSPMLRFLERLYKNPSYRAIQELYSFLAHQFLPITPDGCFLAYKYIQKYSGPEIVDKNERIIKDGDFVDCHTGKSYRNNIGDKPTMPRHQVDDNFNQACGQGLHVGSKSYSASHTNSLICKVDPADVVSVPLDHDCQKVRTCAYEVVEVFENQDLSPQVVDEWDDSGWDDNEWDGDNDDDDDIVW